MAGLFWLVCGWTPALACGKLWGVGEALSVSSAEGLVGREAELALTAAAVRQLSEGRASALAIEGEAGIGKTRLVQSIVDDARSRDAAVFCGQAPFERTRPFGVVAAAPCPALVTQRAQADVARRMAQSRGIGCTGRPPPSGLGHEPQPGPLRPRRRRRRP